MTTYEDILRLVDPRSSTHGMLKHLFGNIPHLVDENERPHMILDEKPVETETDEDFVAYRKRMFPDEVTFENFQDKTKIFCLQQLERYPVYSRFTLQRSVSIVDMITAHSKDAIHFGMETKLLDSIFSEMKGFTSNSKCDTLITLLENTFMVSAKLTAFTRFNVDINSMHVSFHVNEDEASLEDFLLTLLKDHQKDSIQLTPTVILECGKYEKNIGGFDHFYKDWALNDDVKYPLSVMLKLAACPELATAAVYPSLYIVGNFISQDEINFTVVSVDHLEKYRHNKYLESMINHNRNILADDPTIKENSDKISLRDVVLGQALSSEEDDDDNKLDLATLIKLTCEDLINKDTYADSVLTALFGENPDKTADEYRRAKDDFIKSMLPKGVTVEIYNSLRELFAQTDIYSSNTKDDQPCTISDKHTVARSVQKGLAKEVIRKNSPLHPMRQPGALSKRNKKKSD